MGLLCEHEIILSLYTTDIHQGESAVKSKFYGKSFDINPLGTWFLRLRPTANGGKEELYTWKKVTSSVIGIITGHMARSRSKADGRADNEMGRWGLILGIVFLALLAFGWMLGISAGIVGGMVSLLGA